MSELIAEARVLVTPDTTTFRPLLLNQVTQASAGVTVAIPVTPVFAGGAAAAATSLAAAQQQVASAANLSTEALRREQALLARGAVLLDAVAVQERASAEAITGATAARERAAASTAAYTRRLSGLTSGAASAGLSLVGLRGATLAATGPFLAGAAGAIALGKAVGIATSFNSEIAVLGATTGATGEQLEQAAAAARAFGRDITLPGVTAGDAAKTITEFSKAGLDLNDSIAATRGGLQLAQAAQLSYEDAVTLSANALNAFNLEGNEAVRVADTLANAANLAQGGIADTALALRQAAGAAAVVGVSFEDTTALLTLLAKNGLTGSDAGTALRTAFIRLVNPSKQAVKILDDLNVNLRDINGNVRPEVFAEFAEAQANLSAKTQQANAAIVFGQDAFRAFGFLGREGRAGLDEVRAGLERTGTAAEIAQARMTGLAGAQENLSNQLSSLGETIGQAVTPALTVFVEELADSIAAVGFAAQGIGELKRAFDGLQDAIPGTGLLKDFVGFTFSANPFANPLGVLKQGRELFGDEADQTVDSIGRSGLEIKDAIEEAGREASRGAVSFGEQFTNAIEDAFSVARDALESAQRSLRANQLAAVGRGAGQAAGLQEQFDALIAGGGSLRAQIVQLQRQAQVQARIIESAGPNAAGVLLQARRAAQAKLASINQQIIGIERQIAAEQKAAQDEATRIAQDAARERDRAFLQRQEDARTRAGQRITLAEDTPALTDDIRRQRELRALIKQQIDALRASAVDEKSKQAAIRALQAATFATTQAIKALRQTQKEQREEQRQAQQDQIAENLSLRTQIAEERGQDNAVLVALNNEIANQRKRVQAAKKAGEGVLQETLALEQLLRRRRELREKIAGEETTGGKSLAQFLTENAELFARTASNIGTVGVDPLSGFDFSRSIVATTQRLQQAARDARAVPTQQTRVPDAIDRLIAALDRNTQATEGNAGTGGTAGGVNVNRFAQVAGARAQAMADFWQAQQARNMEQARFDGGGGI